MTGVEPQTSGIKSNRSTNWVPTTSRLIDCDRLLVDFDISVVKTYQVKIQMSNIQLGTEVNVIRDKQSSVVKRIWNIQNFLL